MVYVIKSKAGNYRKIGSSSSPLKRLKEVQTGCPFELMIEMVGAGTVVKEIYIHSVFADFRLSGEWFRIPRKEVLRLRYAIERLDDDECSRYLRRKDAPRVQLAEDTPHSILYFRCPGCKQEFSKEAARYGGRCKPCANLAAQVQRERCGVRASGKDNESAFVLWAHQEEILRSLPSLYSPRSKNIARRKSRIPLDEDSNGGWSMVVKAYEDYSDN